MGHCILYHSRLFRLFSSLLLLVSSCLLFSSCRSEHFENQSKAEKVVQYQAQLVSSSVVGACPDVSEGPNCYRVQMMLGLETLQKELVRNHLFHLQLIHDRIKSPTEQDLSTDSFGKLTILVDLENSSLDLTEVYELGMKLGSKTLGSLFLNCSLQLSNRSAPVLDLHPEAETSFKPMVRAKPLSFEIKPQQLTIDVAKQVDFFTTEFSFSVSFQIDDKNTGSHLSRDHEITYALASSNAVGVSFTKTKTKDQGMVEIPFQYAWHWPDDQQPAEIPITFQFISNNSSSRMGYRLFVDFYSDPPSLAMKSESEVASLPTPSFRTAFQRLGLENLNLRKLEGMSSKQETGSTAEPYQVSFTLKMEHRLHRLDDWVTLGKVRVRGRIVLIDASKNPKRVVQEAHYEQTTDEFGHCAIDFNSQLKNIPALDILISVELPDWEKSGMNHFYWDAHAGTLTRLDQTQVTSIIRDAELGKSSP